MLDKKKYYREYYKKNKKKYAEYLRKYQQSEKGQQTIKKYRKEYYKRPEVIERRRKRDREIAKQPGRKRFLTIQQQLRRCIRMQLRDGKLNLRENTIFIYEHRWKINFQSIINNLKPIPKDFENYEIDHIIPITTFDLTNDEEVTRAFAKTNLRLIPITENRRKSNSYQ